MNDDNGVMPAGPVPAGLSRVTDELAGAIGGVEPVNRFLCGVCDTVVAAGGCEVAATLTGELARRYLRAVRGRAAGAAVPRSWQVLFDHRDGSPLRMTLAGVHTVVAHDLAPAVVSTCTLLGRTPGPTERDAADRISAALADVVRAASRAVGDRDPDGAAAARGLELLLGRRDPWRHAELLWTLRGRPAEAEAERAALDWRTSVVGLGLLGEPAR